MLEREQFVADVEIFSTIRKCNPGYSYKEATLNPTNPRDRTADWEADVVRAFQNDRKLTEVVGERDGGRGRSLHLARPIRIVDAKCLVCHDTADRAPAPLIKTYGPDNGFGWKLDEVVGAQIVSVPMRVPLTMAGSAFKAVLGTVPRCSPACSSSSTCCSGSRSCGPSAGSRRWPTGWRTETSTAPAQVAPGDAAPPQPPPSTPSPAPLTPVTPNPALAGSSLEAVEVELGRHVGPLARVLIKRAARTAGSLRELIRAVEVEIEDAAARRAFRSAVDKLR